MRQVLLLACCDGCSLLVLEDSVSERGCAAPVPFGPDQARPVNAVMYLSKLELRTFMNRPDQVLVTDAESGGHKGPLAGGTHSTSLTRS